MNIQFAVKDDKVYLIEVNPRASRTVPFVAKAIGRPIAKIAARVMAGEPWPSFAAIDRDIGHIAVKEAVFPFARFPGTDPVLSPEMKSTGEVMGIDRQFPYRLRQGPARRRDRPAESGTVFVSVKEADKPISCPPSRRWSSLASRSSRPTGPLPSRRPGPPRRDASTRSPRAPAYRRPRGRWRGAMIFNTTEGWQSLKDSQAIRARASQERCLTSRRRPPAWPPRTPCGAARARA